MELYFCRQAKEGPRKLLLKLLSHIRVKSMRHNWAKQQAWNGDCYDRSETTSSQLNTKHGGAKYSITAANDHWGVGVEGDLVKSDWKVDGAVNYESKPAANEWLTSVDADIKSPNMSGVKMFMNVSSPCLLNSQELKGKIKTEELN